MSSRISHRRMSGQEENHSRPPLVITALSALILAGCGGSSGNGNQMYTVSAAVSGLPANSSVVLSDNGAGDLTVSANGTVAFTQTIQSGGAYAVAVATQPTGGTCAVNNGTGTMPAHNIIIGVSCAQSYTVSAVVTGITDVSGLVLQDNGTDNLAVASSGTSQFTTAFESGQSYNVTVFTQPGGHICTVLNGSGSVASANVSVTVVCPWHVGYLGYTGPGGGNWIAAYYIDQSTGATTQNDLFPAGDGPWALAVTPNGGFLYADNESDNTVSAYSIDPTNGDLDAVAGSPFTVGTARTSTVTWPHSIAVDPSGHFVYVLDWQSDVVAFGINQSTGALTLLSTTALSVSGAFAVTVSSKDVLYAIGYGTGSNQAAADIAAYTVNTSTGALTSVSSSPFEFLPPTGSADAFAGYGWAIDPEARFLYVSFVQEGAIPRPVGAYTVASIDATTGALTVASGSPFALTHAVDSIVIDNTGSYLYGGNSYENLIQEFNLDPSTGVLTLSATEDLPGTLDVTTPYLSAVDPSNTYLFCSQTPYSPYSINPTTGALTEFLDGSTTNITNAVPFAFSTSP